MAKGVSHVGEHTDGGKKYVNIVKYDVDHDDDIF